MTTAQPGRNTLEWCAQHMQSQACEPVALSCLVVLVNRLYVTARLDDNTHALRSKKYL